MDSSGTSMGRSLRVIILTRLTRPMVFRSLQCALAMNLLDHILVIVSGEGSRDSATDSVEIWSSADGAAGMAACREVVKS